MLIITVDVIIMVMLMSYIHEGDGAGDNYSEGKEIAFTPLLWTMVTIIASKPQNPNHRLAICNSAAALLGFLRSQLNFKKIMQLS